MQAGWKPGFISYQQSELWEWRPRDNKRVVIYLKILLWFVGFVWLHQFLPHASERGLIKLDETRTKNSRMKCDKEIGRILHTRAKKITSAKKGRRLKDDTGVPSCTSVISLMSHCCFSITLLLGQVLEEGKKSKTRPIDVSPSSSSFHRSSQKPWSIDHDIVLVLLFFIRR